MMPAAPRPRGQLEEVAGGVRPRWDTSNPSAWLGQKGRNTGMPLSRLLCTAWHGLSPALAALGAMAAWGLLPVGGWCWRSPGPSPCSFLCAWPAQLPGPGHVASHKAAKLEEGTPTASLRLWACGIPGVLPSPRILLMSLSRRRKSRWPHAPSCWLDGAVSPAGGQRGAGWAAPPRAGEVLFITSWGIFNATLALARLVRGEAVSGPLATVSPLPMQGPGEKPPRRRPAPSIPRGRCFA